MRKLMYIFLISFLLLTPFFANSAEFKITGEVLNWININPATGSLIFVDEEPDINPKTEPLEGVKLSVRYGVDFTLVDTSDPKTLGQEVISDKSGKISFTGNLTEKQSRKIAITVQKDGFIGANKVVIFDENKKEYKVKVFMVRLMNYKKK